jgi:hypothetical protein
VSGMSRRPGYEYTPRGSTRKPCHGCGQAKLHAINEVCTDCYLKLQRYEELVAAVEAASAGRKQRHVQQGGPTYYLPPSVPSGPFSRHDGPREALQAAMLALAEAAGEMDRRPGAQHLAHEFGTPRLWTAREAQRYDWYHGARRLYSPEAAAAFDALDQAIRTALNAAWAEGRNYGSSLVMQLAGGSVSVEDFNKRTTEGAK